MDSDIFKRSDRLDRLTGVGLWALVVSAVLAIAWTLASDPVIPWAPWIIFVLIAITEIVLLQVWGKEIERIGTQIDEDWAGLWADITK